MEYLLAVLSGGVAVALIEGVREALKWKRERRAALSDRRALHIDKRFKALEEQNSVQSEALKYMLYDRIRYLGREYIERGEIDFDDRRILNAMHKVYHEGLMGNGDLDTLMNEVNALKLKPKS